MQTNSRHADAPRSIARGGAALAIGVIALSSACKPPTSAAPPALSCSDAATDGRELALEAIELGAPGSATFVIAWAGPHPLALDARLTAVEGSASQMVQGHGRLVRVRLELDPAAGGRGGFELLASTSDGATRCPVRRTFVYETVDGRLQARAR